MRVFLGLALLASLFWMAASWQSRQTARLVQQRETLLGRRGVQAAPARAAESDPSEAAGSPQAGWVTLVLGRASGAEPIRSAPPLGTDLGPAPELEQDSATSPAPDAGDPSFRYRVRPGDSLSTICRDYYGNRRGRFANLSALVQAVASHNGIASPDDIRAGAQLVLPRLSEL